MARYFIGFLIFIGLIVLLFVLLFTGHPAQKATRVPLSTYSTTDTVMQLTISGPVVADTNHGEIRITIGQEQNTIDIIQGYQGDVVNHMSYDNNVNAYNTFLHALDLAGYSLTRHAPNSNPTGQCATGNIYTYEIVDGATDLQNTWSSSCSSIPGTFGGSPTAVLSLFQAQIPDYSTVTSNVNLGSANSLTLL